MVLIQAFGKIAPQKESYKNSFCKLLTLRLPYKIRDYADKKKFCNKKKRLDKASSKKRVLEKASWKEFEKGKKSKKKQQKKTLESKLKQKLQKKKKKEKKRGTHEIESPKRDSKKRS